MNEGDYLGAMAMASARGVTVVAEPTPTNTIPIEPKPTSFEFVECSSCAVDATACSVSYALGQLSWDSSDPVRPLLVVHPSQYYAALHIAVELNQRIAVWATPFHEDIDRWFVAWRGCRVGSQGA